MKIVVKIATTVVIFLEKNFLWNGYFFLKQLIARPVIIGAGHFYHINNPSVHTIFGTMRAKFGIADFTGLMHIKVMYKQVFVASFGNAFHIIFWLRLHPEIITAPVNGMPVFYIGVVMDYSKLDEVLYVLGEIGATLNF